MKRPLGLLLFLAFWASAQEMSQEKIRNALIKHGVRVNRSPERKVSVVTRGVKTVLVVVEATAKEPAQAYLLKDHAIHEGGSAVYPVAAAYVPAKEIQEVRARFPGQIFLEGKDWGAVVTESPLRRTVDDPLLLVRWMKSDPFIDLRIGHSKGSSDTIADGSTKARRSYDFKKVIMLGTWAELGPVQTTFMATNSDTKALIIPRNVSSKWYPGNLRVSGSLNVDGDWNLKLEEFGKDLSVIKSSEVEAFEFPSHFVKDARGYRLSFPNGHELVLNSEMEKPVELLKAGSSQAGESETKSGEAKVHKVPQADETEHAKSSSESRYPEIENEITDKIDSLMTFFTQKERGSAVILAEPGVGKTFLKDEFMRRVESGQVKGLPANTRFVEVPRFGLESNTKYKGEFEDKLKGLIGDSSQPTILIMDELESFVGAGTHSESSVDVFDMLKPDLASGKVKILGMATHDNWIEATKGRSELNQRIGEVRLQEPTGALLNEKIRNWARSKYQVEAIPDAFLAHLIERSERLNPFDAQPRRSTSVLDYFFSRLNRLEGKIDPSKLNSQELDKSLIRQFSLEEVFVNGKGRQERYQRAEKILHEDLVGLDDLKLAALQNVKRAFLQSNPKDKPLFSILLPGETGAGKSYTGETLAKALDVPSVKIEMSDFKLDANGPIKLKERIAEARRKHPFTVIILDEFEKANEATKNAALEMLDNGRFSYTPADGGNAIRVSVNTSGFVITSNAGQAYLREVAAGREFNMSDFEKAMVADGIPEWIFKRVEHVFPVPPITRDSFKQILKNRLMKTLEALEGNRKAKFTWSGVDDYVEGRTEKLYRPGMTGREASRAARVGVQDAVDNFYFALPEGAEPPKHLSLDLKANGEVVVYKQLDCAKNLSGMSPSGK